MKYHVRETSIVWLVKVAPYVDIWVCISVAQEEIAVFEILSARVSFTEHPVDSRDYVGLSRIICSKQY